MPEAWSTSTGEGVTIAVLDSGVDADHPDLTDHLLPGRDVDDDDTPADGFGSGTHAAGLAAAVTDNGKGIAGAAPDAMILPVRVLDDQGAGSPATLASGIAWAAGERAGVIALTLGGDPDLLAHLGDETVQRALRAATDAGSVIVAGLPTGVDLPDDVPVVLVGDGTGATVDPRVVSAPGDGALSTVPVAPTTLFRDGTDGYEAIDGIGASTALIAGTAALLAAEGRTPVEVADLLVGTARNPEGDPALGAGTVDAATAVTQAAHGG
ncbi:MAG: S8 family serine peptidase, partial [Acidimicrobiales bacterium]